MSDLHYLHCNNISKFSFKFLFKAFAQFVRPSDVSTMESEYELQRCRISDFRDDYVPKVWKSVQDAKNSAGSCMFPSLSQLAVSLVTLPLSFVDVERVFNQVELTKTDLWNRMSLETLENRFVKFGLWSKDECCKDFIQSEVFYTAVMYPCSATGSGNK